MSEQQTSISPRERYREQVRSEVRERAWEQIADAGASALSLKAIAKQMGMTAPALYRYYASRDDLLTELVLAAYRDLADVVGAAAGPVADDASAAARLREIAQAVRAWALTYPHRYLLVYGTPVPGYHAPPEATDLARRIFAPILEAFAPDPAMRKPLAFWTRMHGVLSLEAAGHFTAMPFDPAVLYAEEVESLLSAPLRP
ncbi:TetR/AcrR family transcriptional regulator [Streptacidiphilus cavernicola]|uniref:TetR/AcrR family transcriptional regulator n=1 Tax=Streptacidiphilus cavernicola TaxID=3342716 RepID=A0ABV6W257_9ACTN